MASQKTIELYVYVDGVNDVPFYGRSYTDFVLANGDTFATKDGFVFNVVHSNEHIKIGSFRYDAKRMGGAPIITFSIMYEECLDKLWSDQVYAMFRGEKYFLKQTPTSSQSNDDARYKHDVELIAERTILDDAYFYDAVVGEPVENDVPVTNSTKFNFYGHIAKFVERMNASLQYTGIQKVDENGNVISGYHVVLDEDVVTRDQKQVSFDSAVFSQALQEAYNTFGIPFYFDGQTIHVGFSNNIIEDVLEYGVDGALLSATKQNANFKVVNRATGSGSSDNIPYYYPNNAPKGEIDLNLITTSNNFSAKIKDYEVFGENVEIDTPIVCVKGSGEILGFKDQSSGVGIQDLIYENFTINKTTSFKSYLELKSTSIGKVEIHLSSYQKGSLDISSTIKWVINDGEEDKIILEKDGTIEFYFDEVGKTYKIPIMLTIYPKHSSLSRQWISYEQSVSLLNEDVWKYKDDYVNLEDIGLSYVGTPNAGDIITQRLIKRVNTSTTLQPSIYRATDGKERFYNAINYPFPFVEGYELKYGEYVENGEVHNDAYKKDDGTYYEFTNEYKEGRPREHVFTVDDVKPTIKEMTNSISWVEQDAEGNNKTVFQRIDMFSEFAYNIGDNDETYTDPDGNTSFKHPYFFGKLRKLGFNLFDSASEMGEMTFSMTSGNCGACNFKIGVSEDYPQYNTVQVWEEDTTDANGVFHKAGSLKYDENGYVLCGLEDFQGFVEWQERQQDTVNYEVWIALKKEEDTYGILMPKAPVNGVGGHRPVACSSENANDGDTFVITNINLPDEYIYKAERKLEKAIVKYIWENNVEKFNFSVNFSRIFLEENPDVLNTLNENARLTRVRYNGDEYILYVSSYSYSMNEGDVLPEIRVELDDTLTIAQNALQNAIDGVKSDIASAINAIDVAAIGSRYFLRKDTYDIAEAPINFKGGLYFGDGGDVHYLEDGSAKLTIDHLEVRKKATFTSLEIQEQTHVGGQILITPASMICSKVEELEDAYRCYFESYGENGEEIFNQFIEGDQAISQTFNEWGGHYYWRLVNSVGRDYIDLSKTDCASESDVPSVGDKIIQLGNRTNTARQAAQVLSSHGENAPSFIMYNGINDFSLVDKEVTGILWNPQTQEPQMFSYGNFFFGDRTKNDNGEFVSDFITFQPNPNKPEEKKLFINADIQIGAGSKGLSDLSDWKDLQREVDEAQEDAKTASENARKAQETANIVNASVDTLNTRIDGLDGTIAEINNKLDGVVESYFDDYTPSRSNEPAATWIAEGTEADHVGDTFTNTELTGDNAGKSWRWLEQTDGTYDWQQIADSDAAKALSLAAQAQAAADGKTTTFLRTPTNYKVGDIWIVGDVVPEGFTFKKGDILTTDWDSKEYVANHWHKFVNFTDELEKELSDSVRELESYISATEQVAKGASERLSSWADDDVISPPEKQAIKDEYAFVIADKQYITTEADRYGLEGSDSVANFTYACYLYESDLKKIIDATTETVEIPSNMSAHQSNYYNARTALLGIIAEAAKSIADSALSKVSDIEYLSEAFDTSVDINGVVMSQMVAVKNKQNEVEAFLNGSEQAQDSEHGKLLLAGGIPTGTGTLAERSKTASTRIYEDGCSFTKNMHLENGCTIGDLNISENGIIFGEIFAGDYLSMSDGNILVMNKSFNGKWQYVAVGGCTGYALSAGIGSPSCVNEDKDIAFRADAPNGYAIFSLDGMFAGLRPKSRSVGSGTTYLDELDHTIFAPNSSSKIYLPSTPKEGQEYVVLAPNGGVTIYGNGHTLHLFHDGVGRSSFTCGDIATRLEVRLYWNEYDNKWWVTHIKH